jgi:hypothetical protein
MVPFGRITIVSTERVHTESTIEAWPDVTGVGNYELKKGIHCIILLNYE